VAEAKPNIRAADTEIRGDATFAYHW